MTKKTIFYEQAKYIVMGDAGPFILPQGRGWPSAEYYHKKYGDYVNVIGQENETLFTVRFSQEVLEILKEKCADAQILDINDYLDLLSREISDEIKAADRAIAEQYRGRI